jgi:hypothetical protein
MPSLEFILSGNQVFFTVENRDLHCTLRWSVSEEEPGTAHEVQRSPGNAVFNSITRRIASIPNESRQYEIEDLLPGPGLYYYRVKITSPGGRTWYSPVRHAFTGLTEVKVFPTVLEGQALSVIVPGNYYSLSIHAATGQLQLSRPLQKGFNQFTDVSFKDGIYYYAIRNSKGCPVKTGRLLMKTH